MTTLKKLNNNSKYERFKSFFQNKRLMRTLIVSAGLLCMIINPTLMSGFMVVAKVVHFGFMLSGDLLF